MDERPDRIDACYVCVHVSCGSEGSRAMRDTLRERLGAASSPVEVREVTCFGACHRAPNLVVYPQGTWYQLVKPEDLDDILAHIQGSEPPMRLTDRVDPELHQIVLDCFDAFVARESDAFHRSE